MPKYFYRTINDLNDLIKENLARLQSYNFDLIVGLPRRGMIPATLIGLFLNKPVVSFNELNANLASEKIGYRLQEESAKFPKSYSNILLVDDSTDEGTVFEQAFSKLDEATAKKSLLFLSMQLKKAAIELICIWKPLKNPNFMNGIFCIRKQLWLMQR